ncbi:MAG: MBL fold metallo-hydrolase, partial [Flavobacteriales bacterium]
MIINGMQITAVAVLTIGMLMGAAFTGKRVAQTPDEQGQAPIVMLLGIAQDGGYPQAGCHKACCSDAWNHPTMKRHVSCLAVIDPQSGERWLIDATPDFREQLYILDSLHPGRNGRMLDGIFLTHAHIGHYAGLVNLGREVAGADHIPVFAMPRMWGFLQNNGPWDQLIKLGNIELKALQTGIALQLNERISIMPFLVPHRQEYSETVG